MARAPWTRAAGRLSPGALLLAAVLALGACQAAVWPQEEPTDLTQVGPDQVLVVGAVEIVPPLRENERELDIPNDLFNTEEMIANRAFLRAAADPGMRPDDSRHLINPRLGETFFFSIPRDAPYLVGGEVTVRYKIVNGGVRQRKIHIPGPLHVRARRADGAVYVGTLRLTRDEFNEVVKVQVIDQYTQAAKDFRQRFGPGVQLRRSLLQAAAL